jgi:hypothetical protein
MIRRIRQPSEYSGICGPGTFVIVRLNSRGAIEALDRGDVAQARALCEEMKHEWRYLHDLMVEGVGGLISFIGERLGDDGVAEAWTSGQGRGWKRDVETIASRNRRRIVHALGVTQAAHDWSYGREDFPLYCTHCSFMNESLPIKWIGYPLYPSDPPDDFGRDPCTWYWYKDPADIPDRHWERYGLERASARGDGDERP